MNYEYLNWQAAWIGAKAKRQVTEAGFSGRIIAVLTDAAYLSGRDEDILWLVQQEMPRHGRGISCPFPLSSLLVGDCVRLEGNSLKISAGLVIDPGQAVEWKPLAPKSSEIQPLIGVRHFVRQLLETIPPFITDDGSGRAIVRISSLLNAPKVTPFSPEDWRQRMFAPIFDLMNDCLQTGPGGIGKKGRDLIGLGPGLTPSGDDFIGGLLFAIHWLREVYPEIHPVEPRSILTLVQWARNRTHPISHAILADLAIGEGPEPLHELLQLLLKGGDPDGQTAAAINGLSRVGHSTGWFILAGLLTGLLSVAENPNGSYPRLSQEG